MLSRPASLITFLGLLLGAFVHDARAADPASPSGGGDPRHFELRVYDVAAGKLEAVLARFRNHIDPLYRRHGITPLGFWTGKERNDRDKFVYLLAAPDKARFTASFNAFLADEEFKAAYNASERNHGKTVDKIESFPLAATPWSPKLAPAAATAPRAFELRFCRVIPGRMDDYLGSYRDHRLRLFAQHGFTNLGFWTCTDKGQTNLCVLLLAHQSVGEIEKSKAAYHADTNWQAAIGPLEAQGPLTTNVVSLILAPADFSAWK